jgi:chromosome segregation ATPase
MTRRAVARSRSSPEIDREVSLLYGLPLNEFTPARNALAARLRKAGDAERADEVNWLKKPTPSLWAINQVARQDPEAMRELVEAVARLRATQERRRSEELDEATRQDREAFGRVVELVRRRLTEAGSRDTPDTMARVTATLRGAAAEPSRLDELRRGTLKEELRAPGFEVFAGGMPPSEMVERIEKPERQRCRDESPAERRGRERGERAREALRVAEAEVADWRRRAEELDKAVADRRKAADGARQGVDELKRRLAEAQERLGEEQRAAEQARQEAARARRDATKAEARVDAARRATGARSR